MEYWTLSILEFMEKVKPSKLIVLYVCRYCTSTKIFTCELSKNIHKMNVGKTVKFDILKSTCEREIVDKLTG